MSFQPYNFNKVARHLHQLGKLVFECWVVHKLHSAKCKNAIQAVVAGWLPMAHLNLPIENPRPHKSSCL